MSSRLSYATLFTLSLGLGAAGCGKGSDAAAMPAGPPPPMPVKIVTLSATPVRDSTEYIGTIKSRQSITVQPQVDGQLTKIFVKSGDVVEPGTPLMQIDPARQQASVNSAQATRSSREAALQLARKSLERSQSLYAKGAAGKEEVDQAKAAVDAAVADVASLGAQIKQNQVQLDYYKIVAPAHGVVGDIPVRVGDHVTPATNLTTLDDNSALEAYISVPIERSSQLQLGMEVQIFDSGGAPLGTGKVHFISPQVNADTQSILIKSDVQAPAGVTLRAEQFIRAKVVWSSHDGVVVPALGLVRLNGQTFVYTAEDQGGGKLAAKLRPVTLGELNGDSYVVVSGLKAGDRVVASGIQKLGDGAPVMDAPAGPPPGAPGAAPASKPATPAAKPAAAGKK